MNSNSKTDVWMNSFHYLFQSAQTTPYERYTLLLYIMPSSSSSIFGGSGGRRGQKTLVVLTATALLAASSLLSVLLAASSLLFAFQDHRQILLQLKSLNDPSASNADPSDVTNQQQQLLGGLRGTTTEVTDDVPWFIKNAQWCHDPEDDEHYAPPIDYNDCSNSTLIHMDIVGGMTVSSISIICLDWGVAVCAYLGSFIISSSYICTSNQYTQYTVISKQNLKGSNVVSTHKFLFLH